MLARRAKRGACLHPFSVYPNPISPDLAAFKQIADRIPGLAIEDQTQLLPRMRAVKSKSELALMQQAANATAAGYDAILVGETFVTADDPAGAVRELACS